MGTDPVHVWSDPVSGHGVFRDNDQYILTFPGIARFFLPDLTSRSEMSPVWTDSPTESVAHLYHDHVLPRVIAHQGDLVLHAGGIVIDGKAVAITAHTGRGKSTLTASLHAAGHPILGDDALVVTEGEDGHHVRAVYPSLRLNPDSAARFFPGIDGRPMAHWSDKKILPLGKTAETAPLVAIFVLGEPAEASITRRLPPIEACLGLIANSFALDPTDKARAKGKMLKAAALTRNVPAWELRYPRDYDCLPEVHQLIRAHLPP